MLLSVVRIQKALSAGAGFLAALALAGCGSREIVIPERTPTPLDLATVGTVTGTVLFAGTPPERKPVRMAGFPACTAAHPEPPLDESVIVNGDRLQNAFLWIRRGLEGRVFAIPGDPVVIDQKGCIYTPHVVGARVYQPVLFRNSDPLLHNVHSEPAQSPPFNFAMPVIGLERRAQFAAEEVAAPVVCDVHGWMGGWVGAVDHPYFSVSGADGTYRIENLPPGEYALGAWHEVLGTREQSFRLEPQGEVVVDFTFAPS